LTLSERRALLDKGGQLSVRRQCALLSISRSTAYYELTEVSDDDLAVMRLIDEEHLRHPFEGSRLIREMLRRRGAVVNRKRVQRLMRLMGLEGLNPRRGTSRPHPGHKIYPYLLRGLDVVGANQVWATDITYIPMAHGFVYLAAIIDWFSRRVLAWRISNTLDVVFCIEALEQALSRWGSPEIFNSDQGSQFTSEEFVGLLLREGIRVSMDGKGRWRDNVFVERLWRSVKYEEVYLHAYVDVAEAKRGIGTYLDFCNDERPHQAHAYLTPSEVYFASMKERLVVKEAA
jgi:putative transposase